MNKERIETPNDKQWGYLYGLLKQHHFILKEKEMITKDALSVLIDFLTTGEGANLPTVRKHLEKRGTASFIEIIDKHMKDSPYALMNPQDLTHENMLAILEMLEFSKVQKQKVELELKGDYFASTELDKDFVFAFISPIHPFHFLGLKSAIPLHQPITDKQWKMLRRLASKNGYKIEDEGYLDKQSASNLIRYLNEEINVAEEDINIFLKKEDNGIEKQLIQL